MKKMMVPSMARAAIAPMTIPAIAPAERLDEEIAAAAGLEVDGDEDEEEVLIEDEVLVEEEELVAKSRA
jgi:hypothetical protein